MLPGSDVEFEGQEIQDDEAVPPENEPALQAVQVFEPLLAENVPGRQGLQDPVFKTRYPGLHTQEEASLLPCSEVSYGPGHARQLVAAVSSEYVPSAHGWQKESPSWDLYVPASHAVHQPRRRVKPLEQKQSEAEVAPAADVSCSPQVSAQISFPRSGLNVPGSHGAQTESTWLIG